MRPESPEWGATRGCFSYRAKEFLASLNNNGSDVYYKEDGIIDNDVQGITSVGYYVLSGAQPCPPDL